MSKTFIGGTGIYSDKSQKDAFNYFIDHSEFRYLTQGSNGMTVIAHLKPSFVSPYKHLDETMYNEQVTSLLLKLIVVGSNAKGTYEGPKGEIEPNSKELFSSEVNFQLNLFNQSVDYLNPLCPAIVFSNVVEPNFLNKIEFPNIVMNTTFRRLMTNMGRNGCKLGVIGMEFADGYKTMGDELNSSLAHEKKILWAISAYLGVKYKKMGIPQPKALLLCAPGTGPLNGARLSSYKNLPADTKLVIVSSTEDHVVGEPFQQLIFSTAKNTPTRNFIRLYRDDHGSPALTAGHNECYSLNEKYDCGMRNPTIYRSYLTGKTDAVDYFVYWKILDALLDCVHRGDNCDYALGNTPQQTNLGNWSDGTPIKKLEVTLPKVLK
jgi:hypothetical protein